MISAIALSLGFVSSGFKGLAVNVAAGAASASASVYMGHFWDEKGKVPFVDGYNEAIESSKAIRGQLALLGLLWGVSSFFHLLSIL
jgi:hypothetical protein